ncbi:hypothetical protein Tco_1057803 [Tanacetum coccineum]|uniref:HECT domain-containing protein n=1 Tax=Tanacetum coccineum TaxID=301880 RepID=A0ABQ5H6M0_9ASTR
MDDPNITMEEYIKLEEEKARRRAIVIDDAFELQYALLCKSQVSTPVNNEIDFRISFDESDDEDYTIICDKNLFSYKMIFVNNLKTDSENDNEKAGVPSFPPPKTTTSYIDDLDFFNDFENEFPAIVYNDAQTSKSDLLTEPILSPQHIDEFNLNDETSVSEYDEEEQNILYFNDIFPFNIIRPDDLNSEKDNNDNDIDIIQSSEGNEITHRSNMLMDTSCDKIDEIFHEESFVLELNVNIFDPKRYYKDDDCVIMLRRPRTEGLKFYNLCAILVDFADMALPLRKQRHPFLRYQGLEYTDADIEDFEARLDRIYRREVHRVQIFDFEGLSDLMVKGLSARMLMEYQDDQGVSLFTSRAWRQLFDIRGPLVHELILEFFSTFRFGQAILDLDTPGALQSARQIPNKGDLRDYWIGISSARDFLGTAPSYTAIRDPILRLCHRYLRLFAVGRKSMAHISSGQFAACLAEHFGLLTVKILRGLTVIALELLIIDMAELPDAAVGAPRVAQDAQIIDEGGQADPTPVQEPPPPPPAPARTMPQRMARLKDDIDEIRGALTEQREVIDAMACDFSRFSTWAITGLARMMDWAGVAYVPYSKTYVPYQRRRVRQRTGEANTSAAQQDPQQPDP